MEKNNRKDMPKAKEILSFWAEDLICKYGKFWLDDFYEYGPDKEMTQVCFACGSWCGTERAHIIAIWEGGDNSLQNLHLLCKHCHLESEYITDKKSYFEWFESKSPSTSGSYLALQNKVKFIMSDDIRLLDFLEKSLEKISMFLEKSVPKAIGAEDKSKKEEKSIEKSNLTLNLI